MSIKEVFKDSVKIVIKHYWLFLLVTLTEVVFQDIIKKIVYYFFEYPPYRSVASVLSLFMCYVGLFVLLLRIRNDKLTKQRGIAFLKNFWKLFILIIAFVFFMTVGMIAISLSRAYLPVSLVVLIVCLVLGPYLFCRYLFAGIIIIDTNCSIGEAFATSSKITKGNIFKILLFVLFIIVPACLQIPFLRVLFGSAEVSLPYIAIAIVAYLIATLFLLPFEDALYLKYYEALRLDVQKEIESSS